MFIYFQQKLQMNIFICRTFGEIVPGTGNFISNRKRLSNFVSANDLKINKKRIVVKTNIELRSKYKK